MSLISSEAALSVCTTHSQTQVSHRSPNATPWLQAPRTSRAWACQTWWAGCPTSPTRTPLEGWGKVNAKGPLRRVGPEGILPSCDWLTDPFETYWSPTPQPTKFPAVRKVLSISVPRFLHLEIRIIRGHEEELRMHISTGLRRVTCTYRKQRCSWCCPESASGLS